MAKKAKETVKTKKECHLSGMHAMVYVLLIIFGAVLLKMFFVDKAGYSEDIYYLVYYGFWFVVALIMLLAYEFS